MNLNATLIGQMLTFLFFVWFTWKLVWPPVIRAMEDRQRKIAEGLAAADQSIKDLHAAGQQAAHTLDDAKRGATQLLDKANKRANEIIDEAKAKAREESQRIVTSAKAEIDREIETVKQHLRGEMASLVIASTEKLLQKSIDARTNTDLIHKMITEL